MIWGGIRPLITPPKEKVELYGLLVPKGTAQIAVELMCYKNDRRPEQGGLGKHQHFVNAFKLMWPKYEWSEWVEKIVEAWCTYKWIIIIGHQRASKTYTIAHCVLLDYLADPNNTLSSMATVTFEGLTLRMWSDLMHAAESATGYDIKKILRLQSTTNKLRVYPKEAKSEAAEKFQIHGIAVTQSEDAEGRIRGGHAPRRRIVLDEAADIAKPIFEAVINPMSAPDAKCVMLTNPMERVSVFGEWCEPKDGWNAIRDTDLSWQLKKFPDGICLHLDGLQSPNIRAREDKYTGLLTQKNIDEVLSVHGMDSLQWWALVRGFFAPDGVVGKVFPSAAIDRATPNLNFDWRPMRCATLDPAFEHDQCVLHLGDLGTPIFGEKRYAINATESIEIKTTVSQGSEPKDYQIAHQVIEICKMHRVRPEHFIMDMSGGGRGVFAIIQKEWSKDVHGIDYGGAATERPLRGDSAVKCEDLYLYFVSELWFRASEYCKSGLIGGLKNLHKRTTEDLSARRYQLKRTKKGTVQVVDPKAEVKKQIGRSPDHGDAFVQFAELLERLGTRPGQQQQTQSQSSAWNASKENAKKAASVYNEEKEFSYHGPSQESERIAA